jgi:hypothetical protein
MCGTAAHTAGLRRAEDNLKSLALMLATRLLAETPTADIHGHCSMGGLQMTMKIVFFSVLAAFAFSASAYATNSGQLDVTITDVTTAESIETAEDKTVFSLDQLLVATGEGVLNNTTARCLALEVAENETGASVTNGFCTFVDADGDKIFEEFEIARDSLNAEASGTGTFTGGTGKYAGISGDVTHTRTLLLPGPKEGVFPGIGTITGTVSLH